MYAMVDRERVFSDKVMKRVCTPLNTWHNVSEQKRQKLTEEEAKVAAVGALQLSFSLSDTCIVGC